MDQPPKKSRFRLSLRALMVIVLVSGGLMGWEANRARTQRRAVAAIKALNGNVSYDFQYTAYVGSGLGFSNLKEPTAPKWLRKILGDEYFQEVTIVVVPTAFSGDVLPIVEKFDHLVMLGLTGPKIDDAALARIAKLPRLQSLSLSQSTVTGARNGGFAGMGRFRRLVMSWAPELTDEGIASLARLPDLRSVEIQHAPRLTDRSLKELEPRLPGLETLILTKTAITDAGMISLKDARKLGGLSLDTKIGDAGLAHLRDLDSLTNLAVDSSEVTDEGLIALRGLKKLRALSLCRSRVTGPGLANLEDLSGLMSLFLNESRITDEGLDDVRKLAGLKSLYIRGTQVSPKAIAGLQAARPGLKIVAGPMPVIPTTPKPPPAAPAVNVGP